MNTATVTQFCKEDLDIPAVFDDSIQGVFTILTCVVLTCLSIKFFWDLLDPENAVVSKGVKILCMTIIIFYLLELIVSSIAKGLCFGTNISNDNIWMRYLSGAALLAHLFGSYLLLILFILRLHNTFENTPYALSDKQFGFVYFMYFLVGFSCTVSLIAYSYNAFVGLVIGCICGVLYVLLGLRVLYLFVKILHDITVSMQDELFNATHKMSNVRNYYRNRNNYYTSRPSNSVNSVNISPSPLSPHNNGSGNGSGNGNSMAWPPPSRGTSLNKGKLSLQSRSSDSISVGPGSPTFKSTNSNHNFNNTSNHGSNSSIISNNNNINNNNNGKNNSNGNSNSNGSSNSNFGSSDSITSQTSPTNNNNNNNEKRGSAIKRLSQLSNKLSIFSSNEIKIEEKLNDKQQLLLEINAKQSLLISISLGSTMTIVVMYVCRAMMQDAVIDNNNDETNNLSFANAVLYVVYYFLINIDSSINCICLMLQFSHTHKYFNKFCGKCHNCCKQCFARSTLEQERRITQREQQLAAHVEMRQAEDQASAEFEQQQQEQEQPPLRTIQSQAAEDFETPV